MRRLALWAIGLAALVGVANVPTTTSQGVNYVVSTRTLPAYVKALDFADRGVEPRNPFRDRRGIVGKLHQLVSADAEVGEHRVGEDLAKLGRAAAALAALRREALHVDVERLGQPQQDSGGDRPLVALEMIEIGARDAELARHLALVEPTLAAQSLEPCAEEELALKHRQ